MKSFKISLTMFLVMLVAACGGSNHGAYTSEQVAVIYFSGAAKGAQVTVGEGEMFVVDKQGERNSYKVAAGKQKVVIKKDGVIVVDRLVLLGDGQSKEFNVPNLK
jgi:hypothetical protein